MSMRSIYRKIAKQNGVSIKEVKEELKKPLMMLGAIPITPQMSDLIK